MISTIFFYPNRDSPIYKKVIFGPVLSILTFNNEEEAIDLANGTCTGLW